MESSLEVLLAPAELAGLPGRDLSRTACVVFDVLRATTSMINALANGAASIFAVSEIEDALRLRASHPGALLAGERHGRRILAAQAGGTDFDLGNSPREFTRRRVDGREIIMTTTNGTRALQACHGARRILAGSFLNLSALAGDLKQTPSPRLLIVCAGTYEDAAYEDILAAGALCDTLWDRFEPQSVVDSAQAARQIYLSAAGDLPRAMALSRNARRLLSIPELSDDVAFSLQRDTIDLVAEMRDGALRRSDGASG